MFRTAQGVLRFNVDHFRVSTSGSTTLSAKAKLALIKEPYERDHDDIEELFLLTQQMKVIFHSFMSENFFIKMRSLKKEFLHEKNSGFKALESTADD